MAASNSILTSHRKLALVIGNNDYSRPESQLRHCINDASDLSDLLKSINFNVNTKYNLNNAEMVSTMASFSKSIKDGDLVLVYFSGHGYQAKNQDYLMPIDDTNIETKEDVEDHAVPVERTIDRFATKNPSYVTIFILDCCRKYWLKNTSKKRATIEGKGLHGMDPPAGTYIQFACAANRTACDGSDTDRNGLFTKHLLKHITRPNKDIVQIFQSVAAGVYAESGKTQKPLGLNGLLQDGYVYLHELVLVSSDSFIDENSQQIGSSSHMPTAPLDNLSSYHINPKELEKNKLHKAAWEGNLNKVQRLAGRAQINVKDQHSRTPLHLAVVRGHIDIVKYLVHEGARLDLIDNEQRTPLVKAVLSGSQNPKLTYSICVALLDGGADIFINTVDINGKNALHYAVDFRHDGLVDLFLLVRNCDPNFRDREQMTPLHLAVQRNNANIVAILLSEEHEQQPDPNLINKNGQTPLYMAASAGHGEIVRILLESNLDEPCDPTIVDTQQLTAFQIAQANRNEQCAKMINDYQQKWSKLSLRRQS